MARKSRKETLSTAASEQSFQTALYIRAALYVRLSVEDTKTTSISIETQQMILARFLESRPEIFVYKTYIDNGATGTNFHRPGFQQMLADIEAGLVNCVIVKDLSRLGRNTIDTGYYIEQYFPAHKVRFIAVNDQFDSADPDNVHAGIILPLKNMINEAYALDIGKKIKAQQRQAMKDGEFVGARTPYGYRKAPDDCHRLLVDPEAAETVQRIFQRAAEHAGLNTIARELNEAGVIAPSHYKQAQGIIENENLIGNGHWQTRTVSKILHSEIYTGDMVQGHTKTFDHKQIRAGADNLISVSGTHEAIVSHELFDRVQLILEKTAELCKERDVDPYTPNVMRGKVFCAHCGGSLHRQRNQRRKTAAVYFYHCLSNSRVARGSCPGVTIRETELLSVLLTVLLEAMNATIGQYALLLNADNREQQRKELTEQAGRCKADAEKYRSRIRGLYEDFVLGVLTSEDYFSFKEQYETQLAASEQEADHLEQKKKQMDMQLARSKALSQDMESIRQNHELTAALIDRLVERVEISHDKHIKVKFRFQSEFREYGEEGAAPCQTM